MKKSKIFARKIVAIVLSVLMAMSTFTGVLTVYATSKDDAHEDNLAANFMAWAETTDNQTCEALLDWVDDILGKADIAPISLHYNFVVIKVDIDGYLDSVDGAIDLVQKVHSYVEQYKGTVGGDVKNLALNPLGADLKNYSTKPEDVVSKCNKSYRAVNNAKDIVMALAETLYYNTNDDYGRRQNSNVIGQFIKGELSLGVANSFVDIWSLIGKVGGLNMWSGYQKNLVYNIVAQVIFNNTDWFTPEEANKFREYLADNSKGTRWNYDEQLLNKLTSEFLNNISIEMTYAVEKKTDENGNETFVATDSSKSRYKTIQAELKERGLADNDTNIAMLQKEHGWDENLRYDRNGEGMIYLFKYGKVGSEDHLSIKPTDKFYDILNQAFRLAWKTGLKPTLETMRVNDNMDWYEGHGGNLDNEFYYWMMTQKNYVKDKLKWAENYTLDNVKAFAASDYTKVEVVDGVEKKTTMPRYKAFDCASADDYVDYMQNALTYERKVVEDPKYNWRDLSKSNDYETSLGRRESLLFGKLRYSPLADKAFGIQTGPINLYFMQTGFSNLETFIDSYVNNAGTVDGVKYNNIAEALNDCLVAAVKDLFPNSDHVGMTINNEFKSVSFPTLIKTGATSNALTIAKTLVGNMCKVFEYAANTADENILNGYYHNHNVSDANKLACSTLSEANLEEALVPLLVSCIRIVKATQSIHDEDFDYAKDAEGVAYVVLREFLSFSQPNKNYGDGFVEVDSATKSYVAMNDINGDNKKSLFEDALLPMARDAVGYLLSSIVPCRDKNGKAWDFSKSDPINDPTTLFDLLNSVVCYYASTDTYNEPESNTITRTTTGKGIAALLGVVDGSGKCTVTIKNDLWTNLTNIANSIWPTIGVLQYGTTASAGKADAKDLVYDTFISSILDIGKEHGADKVGGLTTVIKQLLTIFTAEPIMNKGIDPLIYDEVLASLVNGIFGAKLDGQQYKQLIPTSADMGNTSTPFDSLVDQKVLARYKGDGTKETGVIGILISNIFCAFGGQTKVKSDVRGQGCWNGAMFAVKAVSYFVNGFLPQLKDHTFGPATISVNNPSRSDFALNTPLSNTYITIKNESVGLNRFYKEKNSEGKTVMKYEDRYFVEIIGLTSSSSTITANVESGTIIEPEGSLKVEVKGKTPSVSENVKFTLTYRIHRGTKKNPKKNEELDAGDKANGIYNNQIAVCSLNFSTDKGWFGSLTSYDSTSGTYYSNNATNYDAGSKLDNIILSSTNPAQAEKIGIGVNSANGVYAVDKNNYAYTTYTTFEENGVEYIGATNVDKYDYRLNTVDSNGNITAYGTWDCGEVSTLEGGEEVTPGYTLDEIKQKTKDKPGVQTRTHIGARIEKNAANSDDAIIRVIKNKKGEIESVGIKPEALCYNSVTAASSIDGLNFLSGLNNATTDQKRWLKVEDGVSSLTPGEYNIKLAAYDDSSYDIDMGNLSVLVADTSGSVSLQKGYKKAKEQVDPYQPTDYKDYNVQTKTSATYENIQTMFAEALKTVSTAPTAKNADSFTSKTELVSATTTVKSETGDPAYKQLSDKATNIPEYIVNNFHSNGTYYYVDEDFKFPVYTNVDIDENDVVNGTYAGRKVQKQDGRYYYVNDNVYKKAWDTTTYQYPYFGKTSEIETYEVTENGKVVNKPYYAKENHTYINDTGMSVPANGKWTYTYNQLNTATKENVASTKTDNRSLFDKVQDKMTYTVEQSMKNIDTSSMDGIVNPNPEVGLMAKRKGMESANYDVASYEKMVTVAKEAEALVSKTGEKDAQGNDLYTTTATSAQLKEAIKEFNKFYGLIEKRQYEGDKIEAEINHLTGLTKANITASYNVDPTTKAPINGVVKFTGGTPKYGKVENGNLVNDGYTAKSWTNYINNLARAVVVAQDQKPANIADTYVAKKELVMAENNLKVAVAATTYTVSGKVTEAIDSTGLAGEFGLAGVQITWSNGNGKTKSTGDFAIELPIGTTTEVTFKAPNGISRTVSFSAEATGVVVGVIAIDYNGDGKVNSTDVALGSKKGEIGENKKISAEHFKNILKAPVNYSSTLQ